MSLVIPPSMQMFSPVMNPALSEHRYMTIEAMSSGLPTRPAGCWTASAVVSAPGPPESSIKDLLPSKRTQRATFRATLPMLPYLLPSGRTEEATFEATILN